MQKMNCRIAQVVALQALLLQAELLPHAIPQLSSGCILLAEDFVREKVDASPATGPTVY